MNKTIQNSSWYYQILLIALLLLVLQISSMQVKASSSKSKIIERLPGFEGPLPFHLETGYIGLGDTDDDMQVFYYFIRSEGNPEKDPLMLWLSGGPGCSSFTALANQIGPIAFEKRLYDGSLPNLVLRPQSWTKVSSIIFVDLPLGTGFSYAKNLSSQRSDWKLVHHTHQFLRKWLRDHSEFLPNKFYMGADSYSGIPVPPIVQEISNGNEKGLQPLINLQGYILGNPLTTNREKNHQIAYAHRMGLLSEELYESLQRNCDGEYIDMDSRNDLCLRDLETYHECISRINVYHILVPYCEIDQHVRSRSLTEVLKASHSTHLQVPDLSCPQVADFLATKWANDESVRKSLHIRKGTKGPWEICYFEDFIHDIISSLEFHANLSAKGYRSLVFSGDHDMFVPFTSTQAWIRALNYSIVDDWRPWFVHGQVGGYTRTYSNRMTFATVKGSGHTGAQYTPNECYAMFTRWLSNLPL